MDKESIGKFIKARRKEKGLSQKDLAESLQVSLTTVSKWETGVNLPDILILKKMADIFNISISDLLELKESAIDAISAVGNTEPFVEKDLPIHPIESTENKLRDSQPKPLPNAPPTKAKARWPKRCAFILSTFLIGIIFIEYLTWEKKSNTFSPSICAEYKGDYEGKNAYYLIMEYEEEPSDDDLLEHGDVIRNKYGAHFFSSDVIVVIYTTSYDDFKKTGFNDTTDCMTVLFPY